MAKQTKAPASVALETLTTQVADPAPKVLLGSKAVPGFFQGSAAATKAAAQAALQEGWLEETGAKVGSGAKARPLYRLTPRGIQAILDSSPAIAVLQGLNAAVGKQLEESRSLTAACASLQAGVQRVSELVGAAVAKIEAPNVADILAQLGQSRTPGPAGPARQDGDWQAEVLRRAGVTDVYNPLPLPQLYNELKKSWPALTLGQFQDGLRTLHDAGRLRLLPYTRALAAVAGDREAVFLDGEVMYYVRGA